MIAYLSGKVIAKQHNQVIVKLPSGVGYLVSVSPMKNFMVNENLDIFIYEVQREDKTELYGFTRMEEREWLEKLLKVPGVGPKIGANIVYALGYETIQQAVQTGDAAIFAQIKGLGAKTAQKIVLELKQTDINIEEISSKLEKNNNFTQQFVETLTSLGYKRGEIVSVITILKKENSWDESDLVETVRLGIKAIGKKN